jgi:dipeptidyl aminopeptidase/acylaminoacyl peptidase
MVLPYGAWPSPLSAAALVEGVATPTELVVDGPDVWWGESRPSERGRVALVRWRDGSLTEPLGPAVNVRTRVHEYGGGAWWVAGGVVYYSDFADSRLRRLDTNQAAAEVRVLTPEPREPHALRYADGRPTPDGRWYVCVREEHLPGVEATNELVAVATDGSEEVRDLVSGMDFYAAPRVSPDGTRLAWLQWSHPHMPWDETELWLGELRDGTIVSGRPVAGSAGGESIGQPEWSPAGELHFVSDREGFSNLYRIDASGRHALVEGPFEIGEPHWVFGSSRYTFAPDGSVVAALGRPQGDVLFFDATDEVLSGWAEIGAVRVTAAGEVVLLAGNHRMAPAVSVVAEPPRLLSDPHVHGLAPAYLPAPELVEFPTNGGEHAFALFYAPAHPGIQGPVGELPPLLVLVHGGPTGRASRVLNLGVRYWTSRGWAVADVDYCGSSGYGRAFRRSLHGRWGLADVADCVAAAQHLAALGRVDGDRLAIKGGSAGGFTVLAALTFHDAFSAGASRYGIADLEALAADTHKFESRYLDGLVAPYPDGRAEYVARSPIHHLEGLRAPMIVLQGAQDEVVPPSQAEQLVAALAANGVEHEYLLFEDEGHGFRRAETIVAALEAEERFFARAFGFAASTSPRGLTPLRRPHGV